MALQRETSSLDVIGRAALLGIGTPLSDVSINSSSTNSVLAVIGTQIGTLSVDAAPGATVRGGGTPLLWVSGTIAQINARLATLTYHGSVAGTDTLTITLIDAQGALTTAVRSPIAVLPLTTVPDLGSPAVAIDLGTLTLDTCVIDGPAIALNVPAGGTNSTTGILINSTLGAHTVLTVRNDNAVNGVMPRLAIAGRVELDGTTNFAGNGSTVTLAQGATLLNEGSMSIEPHAAQFIGAGRLVNDGAIALTANGSDGLPVRIDTEIGGVGVISLSDGAALSLRAGVAASETILLGTGDNTLHLTQPGTFAGVIAGFSRGDTLVFDGVSVTNATYSTASESGDGTLTLFDDQHAIANIRFSLPEPGTVFQSSTDAAGNAMITLAAVADPTPRASVDVYRFFDAAHGTQLLTQDRTERDTIIATRPDLRFEGVGLHAISPTQPDADAVAVYRFFDTSNGTHFLTSSAAERDSVLGSRPDLVLEPGSTIYEHASAQAGDVAVYRFFNQNSGAHFFTADAAERATILSTRPDMTSEGIAFYAPGG